MTDRAAAALRYSASALFAFTRDLLVAAGADPGDAEKVADHLVEANLRGVDTHGVSRLGIYVERVRRGLITTPARVRVVSETPVSALVDGGDSFGQVVGLRAMEVVLEKAASSGVAVVGVRRSTHCGALGYYTRRMAERGYVGVFVTNAPACMAPWGGRVPYLGANPFSIAFPTGGDPVVLDASATVVARGRIILAAQQGKEIPPGWAMDASGQPTTDPVAALKGLVLPVGGHKGYGLALMADVLSGVMTGADFGSHQGSLYDEMGRPQNTGHFLLAMRPDLFLPETEYRQRMDTFVREIHTCPRAAGVEEIMVPGEPEARCLRERDRQGIPLGVALVGELSELAARWDVLFPAPMREEE